MNSKQFHSTEVIVQLHEIIAICSDTFFIMKFILGPKMIDGIKDVLIPTILDQIN